MSSSDPSSYTSPISKVILSPLKDNTGKTDALLVTIKKVDNPTPDEVPKNITFLSPNEIRSSRQKSRRSQNIMAAERKKTRAEMGASKQSSIPNTSVAKEEKQQNTSFCTRHAALRINRKKVDITSEKLSLCNNCSKSMLSYIFLVQDFLDSLAREITEGDVATSCLECVRERHNLYIDIPSSGQHEHCLGSPSKLNKKVDSTYQISRPDKNKNYSSDDKEDTKDSSASRTTAKRSSRERGPRREPKRSDQQKDEIGIKSSTLHKQVYVVSQDDSLQSSSGIKDCEILCQQQNYKNGNEWKYCDCNTEVTYSVNESNKVIWEGSHPKIDSRGNLQYDTVAPTFDDSKTGKVIPEKKGEKSSEQKFHSKTAISCHVGQDDIFRPSMERQQPYFEDDVLENLRSSDNYTGKNDFKSVEIPASLFPENVDGIMSTLSNVEREVYDSARDGAGWERLTELQEGQTSSFSGGKIMSEAFVTMARNNTEALGCLVLGTSLLLCGTTRSLCVLVCDGVSTTLRQPLSSIFHVVQYVRSLDSLGTTKLGLLQQPELGISFDKLNAWRLAQFNKCIYLNPDTLVVQNCDELFCYEELSAVPDIGWPDCFNSGVFVFVPSAHTFWKLLEFAEKQGSYDGGDQGLLNSYFYSWSHDINKKLSFIYNLMANVSYTYTPAFKQFGRNVKIVQFLGSFKPWHVKFCSDTGQIAPSSAVHPTYIQFILVWLNIFRIKVVTLLPQEVQLHFFSQTIISVSELLRFFPSALESEMEFLLSPPSVRLHVADPASGQATKDEFQKQMRSSASERKRRQSAELTQTKTEQLERQRRASTDNVPAALVSRGIASGIDIPRQVLSKSEQEAESNYDAEAASVETSVLNSLSVLNTKAIDIAEKKKIIPGSEVGDYQGMRAWEQGRMDYQGTDSSENIIKRLEFLMSRQA